MLAFLIGIPNTRRLKDKKQSSLFCSKRNYPTALKVNSDLRPVFRQPIEAIKNSV